MDLTVYVAIFWRRKRIVLITVLATLSIVLVGTLLSRPTYTTTATLRLVRQGRNTPDYQELLYIDRLLGTYVQIAMSQAVIEEVGSRLGLDTPPSVEAEQVANTDLMHITITGDSPGLVKQFGDGITEILVSDNQESVRANHSPALAVIVQPSVPAEPANLRIGLNLALGLILGLGGGLGLVLLLENLNPRLYSSAQLEATTAAALLSEIPQAHLHQPVGQVASAPFVEAFRRLRANLAMTGGASASRTIMVTSAEQGEGKSTVASHLAIALAKSGCEVLLVDFNHQTPDLHTLFALPNDWGLSSILPEATLDRQKIQPGGLPHLHVLTSGPPKPDLEDMLSPASLAALLAALAAEFEIVVFDTPAIPASADATVLATLVDKVLLVAAPKIVQRALLQSTLQQLRLVHAPLAGLVINSPRPKQDKRQRQSWSPWRTRATRAGERMAPARNGRDIMLEPLSTGGREASRNDYSL